MKGNATFAAKEAGVSYRQVDYWARTGLVEPSIRASQGSGSARTYSEGDIAKLRVVKLLLTAGLSLQKIRRAMSDCSVAGTIELLLEAQRELIEIKDSDRIAVGQ